MHVSGIMSGLPSKSPEVLRLATLNLWGENGPHERRLALVLEELEQCVPDVLALQEVREVPDRLTNQAETLARHLGHAHVFAPSTVWGGGAEGLAIVSRFPILESRHRRLPHATDSEGRIVLSARLDGPRGGFWVHTTHLSYRQHEGQLREDQVVALDEEVTGCIASSGEPQIMTGDFNTVPESDEIRWLCGLTSLAGRRVFYQDAWATIHPTEPGITWARENPFRARMNWLRSDRRLDYIFVTTARRDGRGTVRDARLAFNQPGSDGVYASDHFGLVADVQMAPDPIVRDQKD